MPFNKLKLSDYEEQRLKNLADNQAMLAKLMKDLKKITPKALKVAAPKPKKVEKTRRTGNRWNPYQLPVRVTRSRSRRGSLSSDGFSSGDSSPVKEDSGMVVTIGGRRFYEEDDVIVPRRASRGGNITERVIVSADDITDEDLDNVADVVSTKVYDQVHGTCCHQCRQKTLDQKTICRSEECTGVRGQFCGVCLRNRYGEDARTALKDPNWSCPPCRGVCNCSICRTREGKAATGILVPLAREHGFDSVMQFLESLRKKKEVSCGDEVQSEEKESSSETEENNNEELENQNHKVSDHEPSEGSDDEKTEIKN